MERVCARLIKMRLDAWMQQSAAAAAAADVAAAALLLLLLLKLSFSPRLLGFTAVLCD